MGLLLFICISGFLLLFVINNDVSVMLGSPLALLLAAGTLVADLYLLRSLIRDWWPQRD
jgi:hypothetical protein